MAVIASERAAFGLRPRRCRGGRRVAPAAGTRGSPGAATRCAPRGRSTRRTGRPAPARGAGRRGGDALAQERRGALEGLGGGAPRRLVAERRVVGARDLQVGADLHVGDGDEADAGIADLPRQQVGQLLPDLRRCAPGATPACHDTEELGLDGGHVAGPPVRSGERVGEEPRRRGRGGCRWRRRRAQPAARRRGARLRHRHAQRLEPILHATHRHPLVLERLRVGEEDLDRQERDERRNVEPRLVIAGDPGGRAYDRRGDALHGEDLDDVADLEVVVVSKPMPHSKPDLTSDTSSLKRRSEPSLPS